MAKFAIIDNQSRVVNLVVADQQSDVVPPEGHTVRAATNDDAIYVDPAVAAKAAEDDSHDAEFRGARTKAKAVFAGTDTFSPAQMQKLVAGLVLRMTR